MNSISQTIDISPRNIHFDIDADDRRDWHGGSVEVTIVFNALSIMFPEGEKFFMRAVRRFSDKITDPVLQKQVKAFMTQEATHTREHLSYNHSLEAQGFTSVDRLDREVGNQLKWAEKFFSSRRTLSATCALEHFTAILADQLMKEPEILEGADDKFRRLWLWHAIEETEHKAVAFDVYQATRKNRLIAYLQRSLGMIATTIMFNVFIFKHLYVMLKDIGLHRSLKSWGRIFRFLYLRPGAFRKIFIPWLEYFKPGFHPWDHDNRHLMAKYEAELSAAEAAEAAES